MSNSTISEAYEQLAMVLAKLDAFGENIQLDAEGALIGESGRVTWEGGNNWEARTAGLDG